jgi:hypothetical protein
MKVPVHIGGWHDVAGALTFKGEHHVFQGCPASLGWSHSVSTDLVHWADRGRELHVIHESYEGMNSSAVGYNSPCSGFVTVDDKGTPCAGFRQWQCTSTQGATGLNPAAQTWDVPMELRCAKNANLTEWGPPEFFYPAYYYRVPPGARTAATAPASRARPRPPTCGSCRAGWAGSSS